MRSCRAVRTIRSQYEFPFGARTYVRSTRTPMASTAWSNSLE